MIIKRSIWCSSNLYTVSLTATVMVLPKCSFIFLLFCCVQAELTRQQNEFKIKLKELEDSLLSRLSSAGGNFLGDTALVENLETTKRTATEIEKKVAEAKVTEKKINEARENYRPAAARSSLLYFILNDLEKINPLYQFSLKVKVYTIK